MSISYSDISIIWIPISCIHDTSPIRETCLFGKCIPHIRSKVLYEGKGEASPPPTPGNGIIVPKYEQSYVGLLHIEVVVAELKLHFDSILLKGSLHRKQKISYETSGRNPTDLDLLDEGSEEEIQSLTLEGRAKAFCQC